jgi:serine-protein kinase ATM
MRFPLEKIHSDKIVDRKDGLTQLKSILTHSSSRLSQISDKAYHKMLDAVFSATLKEKKTYLSKSKAAMTSTVRLRLELCGQVLRAVVEQAVKHLKVKTFRALIIHITQLLEERRRDFTEQFSLEYAKALRIALDWSPHREHLLEEEWGDLVEFLVMVAGDGMPTDVDLEADSFPRSRQTGDSVRLKTETEEYITCIALLVSTPNAPVTSKADKIGDCLLRFLRTHPTLTRAHQPAYSALNSTINSVGTNEVETAALIAGQMIPIIHRQWSKIKQRNIRDQMLINLHYGLPLVRRSLRISEEPQYMDSKKDLDQLVEMLLDDFKGGRDRDVLVLDDLRFSKDFRPVNLEKAPLSLRNFSLRATGQPKEEQNWMIPKVIAELMNVLDLEASKRQPAEDPDEVGYSNKRTKITNYYMDLLLDGRSARATEKVAALQILAFMLEDRKLDANDIYELLGLLINIVNGDEGATADWAMIVAVR